MDETQRVAMITQIVEIQMANNNDDDGDKHLSDPSLALEAIDRVLQADSPSDPFLGRIYREGWFGEGVEQP